jgi:hypothetical protein
MITDARVSRSENHSGWHLKTHRIETGNQMMRSMPLIIRFALSIIIAATMVSCAGRVFSDFDQPAVNDPHDLIRGTGVWAVAILIAVLNELLLHRRPKQDDH